MPNGQDQPILPDTNAQAKAALPKPEYMAPGEDLLQGTKLQKAYDAASSWLGEHEQHLSEKYLAPFRQGLDNMAADLKEAGETGHTRSGGQLTGPTRALASGVGSLLEQVPVGKNVKETVGAMATNLPELPEGHIFKEIEGVRAVPPADIIKEAGLVYKGEVSKGSGVHMFEHPDFPGKTASLTEDQINPESVRSKMNTKIADFRLGKENAEAYRTHTVGQPEIDLEKSHAHATTDLEKAQKYTAHREGGKNQTVSKLDMSRYDPKDYDVIEGPDGEKWLKLKRQPTAEDLKAVTPAPKP
jgi:hypothetical protein